MRRFLALCALFLFVAGQPAFAAASPSYMRTKGGRWGGDGLDAAVSKGAVTETTVLQINATTFTQTASTTYIPKSGSLINSTLTQDWNGTTNVGAGYAGGQGGRAYGAGPAPGGGDGITPGKPAFQYGGGSASGGSGGGNGGAGGAGEGDHGGGGGAAVFTRSAGSGGSGAGANSATGGAGGAGGGLLTVCAVGVITIGSGGSVNANGTAGAAASNHGGGGGAGGTLYFGSQTGIVTTGNISVAGGAGATGSTVDGGGGGGGYVVRHAPSGTITGAGTVTVSGGAAGGAGATAGSSGLSISIPGTPNLPLLGYLEHGGMEQLKQLAHAKSAVTGSNEVEISQYELCNFASNGNVIELAKYLGETMDNSVTTLGVGDVEDKELNAA